jgi:hypothetical protein
MGLIKLILIILIALGYLNNLSRSDFVNIIVPTLILVIFYTSLNSNVIKFLNIFLIMILGALGYDLLWFLFSASVRLIII